MEKCKRKLHIKFYSLAAVAALLLFSTSGSAVAEDDSGGPIVEADEICDVAWKLCVDSCDAAQYTLAEATRCESNCTTIAKQCYPAKRGGAQGNVGDVGTGGVLRDDTNNPAAGKPVQPKKKRKKAIKQ